jgi:hypothetical protein
MELNERERRMHKRLLGLEAAEPPEPWGGKMVIQAGGVLAAGWTKESRIVLVGVSGYAQIEPRTGEKLVRDRGEAKTYGSLLSNNLQFRVPHSGEVIGIFGVWGGGGIAWTEDGWGLEAASPMWPRVWVLMRRPRRAGAEAGDEMRDLVRLGWESAGEFRGCGFSPSGNHLVIVSSSDTTVYSRA